MDKLTEPIIGRFYTYDHGDFTNLALCFRIEEKYIYFIEQDSGADSTLYFNRVTRDYFDLKFIKEEDNKVYNDFWQFDCFREGIKRLFEQKMFYSNYGEVVEDDFFDVKKAIAIFKTRNKITDEFGYYEIDYKAYLQTEHWQKVRRLKFQEINKCQLCGSTKRLEVHHNSYKNLGLEEKHLEDLTVLCHDCHSTFHQNKMK